MHFSEKDNKKYSTEYLNYIGTYDKNDILLEKTIVGDSKRKYIRYQCKYCKTFSDCRSDNKKRICQHCCNCYENSFAYQLQNTLNDDIKNHWDFDKNKIDPKFVYAHTHNKYWFICKEHGSYISDPGHYLDKLRPTRCPICGLEKTLQSKKFSYEYIKSVVESKNHKLLSNDYNQTHDHIELLCPQGHIWSTSFNNFKRDRQCPKCNMVSKGEQAIENFLNKNNIKYYSQYRFDDCKYFNTLPFDFYLPNINICIEFDGKQHYEIIDFFGGIDSFIDTKIRDTIKNIYCKKNNIYLIRIPYWNYENIENILINKLIQERKE